MENNLKNAEKYLKKVLENADKKNVVINDVKCIGDTIYRFNVSYTWQLNATEKSVTKTVTVIWLNLHNRFHTDEFAED